MQNACAKFKRIFVAVCMTFMNGNSRCRSSVCLCTELTLRTDVDVVYDDGFSPLEGGLAYTVDLSAQRDFIGRAKLEADHSKQSFGGLILHKAAGKGRRATRVSEVRHVARRR